MADKRLIEIDEKTTVTGKGLVYFLDNSTATPTDSAMSIENLVASAPPQPHTHVVEVEVEHVEVFSIPGVLEAFVGMVPLVLPFDIEVVGVRLAIGTQHTGPQIRVDVNANNTTIFTDQASRPLLVEATNVGPVAVPQQTLIPAGTRITVDLDQVGGAAAPGANLAVILTYVRAVT